MISVVLPALNEEVNIAKTVETVLFAARQANVVVEIIIVNDGSTDNTGNVIEALRAKYNFIQTIHFDTNRGLGAGFREAIKIAKYDKISTFPGDNCCRPEIMYKLFSSAEKADFLLSFLVNTEYRPMFRRMLSLFYSHTYILAFGLPFKYLNGSPIYPVNVLKQLELKANRYGIFAEINVKLSKTCETFAEIPDYVKPNPSQSSAIRLKNVRETLATFIRLLYEIHFSKRTKYTGACERVVIENDIPWKQAGALPTSNPSPYLSNKPEAAPYSSRSPHASA